MENFIDVVSLRPVEIGLERGRIYRVDKKEWESSIELVRVFDSSSKFVKFCRKNDLLAFRNLYK